MNQDPKSLVESLIKEIAQDSPEELAKRAMNTHKSLIMRMCFCGHNFGKHSDPELFAVYRGLAPTQDQTEKNACAFCECEEFEHIKSSLEPCKCGHDKRYHEEITTPSGRKILKCKYNSCRYRCSFFRPINSESRLVPPEEMKKLVKKGKDKELTEKYVLKHYFKNKGKR